MTGTKRLQRLARLVLLLALVGCGSRYQAPVDQAGETLFLNAGRRHLVNEGETLYAVAWIYDLDFAALARANNLREPYLLTPGQYLDVDLRAEGGTVARSLAPARAPAAGNVVSTATTAPAAVTTLRRTPLPGGGRPTRTELPGNESPSSAPATVPPSSSAETARAPSAPAAAQSSSAAVPSTRVPATAAAGTAAVGIPAVGTPVAPAPSPRDTPPVTNSAPAPAANSAPAVTAARSPAAAPGAQAATAAGDNIRTDDAAVGANLVWDWPHQGNIVGRFSDDSGENKGIDISGATGDPVLVAADGEVVYAGSGLLRYGNLIIVKHSDRFLSAYAHNRALVVAEKDRVRRGQKIAELGSSGIDRNLLHFEIRLDGKPVDPLQYLPALQ